MEQHMVMKKFEIDTEKIQENVNKFMDCLRLLEGLAESGDKETNWQEADDAYEWMIKFIDVMQFVSPEENYREIVENVYKKTQRRMTLLGQKPIKFWREDGSVINLSHAESKEYRRHSKMLEFFAEEGQVNEHWTWTYADDSRQWLEDFIKNKPLPEQHNIWLQSLWERVMARKERMIKLREFCLSQQSDVYKVDEGEANPSSLPEDNPNHDFLVVGIVHKSDNPNVESVYAAEVRSMFPPNSDDQEPDIILTNLSQRKTKAYDFYHPYRHFPHISSQLGAEITKMNREFRQSLSGLSNDNISFSTTASSTNPSTCFKSDADSEQTTIYGDVDSVITTTSIPHDFCDQEAERIYSSGDQGPVFHNRRFGKTKLHPSIAPQIEAEAEAEPHKSSPSDDSYDSTWLTFDLEQESKWISEQITPLITLRANGEAALDKLIPFPIVSKAPATATPEELEKEID